jgi:xylono-1,5-lactonase
MQPTVVSGSVRTQLGEGPLWSPRENAIYWVDILGQQLHRYSLSDANVRSWTMPEKIGWVLERRDHSGFIAGLQSGFVELMLDPFAIRPIHDPEPHHPHNRMNDAKVDHLGRIWAGTMDVAIKRDTGSLYRLDPDLRCTRMDEHYLITNGPAFGARRECMYHTDTGPGIVYRFDLTSAGEIANKRPFIQFAEGWGKPDGMTVDAEGYLWVAHFGGSRVSRFDPNGTLDRAIALPASQITSCTFAGERLDRMFVTSAAVDRDDEALAGALFEVDPGGIRGIAPHYFAG